MKQPQNQHSHNHNVPHRIHSYALKRMSLALQRIIHAPSNKDRTKSVEWFRAWSILDKKLQARK